MSATTDYTYDIAIVSGTHNRFESLKRMVESVRLAILRMSTPTTYQIIIVDAGSTDGSLLWLSYQTDIHTIQHGKRLGAIKAYNDACAYANAKYVVILNDDAELTSDTLRIAYAYLENPDNNHTGQIAFKNIIDTNSVQSQSRQRLPYDMVGQYLYGQCCITRKWLGDLAGWWGESHDEGGYHTYAGDTQLGLRIWELGYHVIRLENCAVVDHVLDDDLRKANHSTTLTVNGQHKDNILWHKNWDNRLPDKSSWQEYPQLGQHINNLAQQKQLKSLRLKIVMPNAEPRYGMTNALAEYGEARQINQTEVINKLGLEGFKSYLDEYLKNYLPNLLILQSQGPDNVQVAWVKEWRNLYPSMYICNFNGDARMPIPEFLLQIGAVVHLNLIASPTFFPWYANRGIRNVAFWPISYEQDYLDAQRKTVFTHDIAFLGSHYPQSNFPDTGTRATAVLALKNAGFNILLRGGGWDRVGLQTHSTDENHTENINIYCSSKLALSVSHYHDLWGYSSDRLLMICATGCPALVRSFPGMREQGFIDGKTCIVWHDNGDLIDKACHYLQHDLERERIGLAGKELMRNSHSWRLRVKDLFNMLRVNAPVGCCGSERYIANHGYSLHALSNLGTPVTTIPGSTLAQAFKKADRDTMEKYTIGQEKMVVLEYIGTSQLTQYWDGPVTKIVYQFGLSTPRGYVDNRDVEGMINWREKGNKIFQLYVAPVVKEEMENVEEESVVVNNVETDNVSNVLDFSDLTVEGFTVNVEELLPDKIPATLEEGVEQYRAVLDHAIEIQDKQDLQKPISTKHRGGPKRK